MRLSKFILIVTFAAFSSVYFVPTASAAHDPCTVLTAASFSKIMGYEATIDKTASNQTSCFYNGPAHTGGQFMILTEAAEGPQADAMLNRRGSTPPPSSGLIGGAYKEGSIIFSLTIKSADQAKLQSLLAEIRRNLK